MSNFDKLDKYRQQSQQTELSREKRSPSKNCRACITSEGFFVYFWSIYSLRTFFTVFTRYLLNYYRIFPLIWSLNFFTQTWLKCYIFVIFFYSVLKNNFKDAQYSLMYINYNFLLSKLIYSNVYSTLHKSNYLGFK